MRPLVIAMLVAATGAYASPPCAPAPATPLLTIEVSPSKSGATSFARAFLNHARTGYTACSADLTFDDWVAMNDVPPGADTAHVLVVEASGEFDPAQFRVSRDEYVSVADLTDLGQSAHDQGGLLRYLLLVTCHVLAHGPDCHKACPLPGQTAWKERACTGHGAPECFGVVGPSSGPDANAVARWQGALDNSQLRMVCGGSTTVRGSDSEADAMWWYLTQSMPPADAFILGLLVQTGSADVPLCLARGQQDATLSPLYDPAFTDAPNDAPAPSWYHVQYPILRNPGDPLPQAETLPEIVKRLAPDPACYSPPAPGCQRVQSCGRGVPSTRLRGSPTIVERQQTRFEAKAIDVVRGIEAGAASHFTRQPRLFEMRVDTYAQMKSPSYDGKGLRDVWTREPRVKAVYAVFHRVVRVSTGATIPELGAGGRVVVAMDSSGDVTHVWQDLRPVIGPRPPAADERVLGVSEARERALAELRSTLGPGESVRMGAATSVNARLGKVAAPDVPQARLETWGFKDVLGELRAFYVFEYIVSTKSGAERVARIEVPAVLHTASGGDGTPSRRHLHHHSSDDDDGQSRRDDPRD